MKKLTVPVLCTLIGCAAGVAAPALTAQTFGAPAPGATTWEQFCEETPPRAENDRLTRWGQLGFRVVSTHVRENDMITACYARPTNPSAAW